MRRTLRAAARRGVGLALWRTQLVFGIDSPWPLLFFSVEAAATLIVDNSLTPAMVIELDGIDATMSPAAALALIRRRDEPSQILYWPLGRDDTLDPSLLVIAAGDVAISFEVWDDEIGRNAELAKLTDAELWPALEANASIDRVMCGVRACVESGIAVVPRRLGPPPYSMAPRSQGVTIDSSVPTSGGPPTTRVRLADFLATGRLGPVHCGLSRNKIALMLGPPDMWTGATIDEQVMREGAEWPAGTEPAFAPYWVYGKLELSFDSERPHAMISSRSSLPAASPAIARSSPAERSCWSWRD